MTSIGIIGGAGVGKSLLAKQLSAINCAPYVPEGELGTFPPRLLEAISRASDKIYLYNWFTDKYYSDILTSNKISKHGQLCFMEASAWMLEAYAQIEADGDYQDLRATYARVKEDVQIIVLLVASRKSITEWIKIRGRDYEQNKIFVDRSIKVQNKLVELLDKRKNVLVVERDRLDFCNYDDLHRLNKRILAFAKKYSRKKGIEKI